MGRLAAAATAALVGAAALVSVATAPFPAHVAAQETSPVAAQASSTVGVALAPGGQGWWVAQANGAVTAGGSAVGYGSAAALALSKPIVGIAATPSGHGYWLVASDGGIFSYGDAQFFGSTGSIRLNQPIVGLAPTPSGHGYWLVAADGGIFSYGDAQFFGSTGSIRLNRPIVGIATSPTGRGYWMVATDGGIFSFGDSHFFGSTGSIHLNQPVVGMAATPTGLGYWLVASDGGIFAFGNAPFTGSAAGSLVGSVVGMVSSGAGYLLATVTGAVDAFGTVASSLGLTPGSPTSPAPTTPGSTPTAPPASTSSSGSPSGSAMPTGNLVGWTQVFADDFTGSSLNAKAWGAYQGQPGGDAGGWWDPSHVVVSNGALNLQTYQDPAFGGRWVSGGVSSAPALKQTYGKYEVRFRMDAGDGVAGVLLLWPSGSGWPPEIDFAEDGGGARTHTSATLHCGTNGNDSCQIQHTLSGIDLTQWHTLGVEWTPGLLSYTFDGTVWATVADARVPAQTMEMDLQTQAGTCGDTWAPCPDASTPAHVDMQVDWVVAYRPA
ncbi:MAG TPA: glycoside hydrolase family 16 protein [Actinomycetota bacterium]|nr:glycoside hydrolase family 16 protein [Actinomycetota bacterium]